MQILSIYLMFTSCQFYGAIVLRVQLSCARADHFLWSLLWFLVTHPGFF